MNMQKYKDKIDTENNVFCNLLKTINDSFDEGVMFRMMKKLNIYPYNNILISGSVMEQITIINNSTNQILINYPKTTEARLWLDNISNESAYINDYIKYVVPEFINKRII